jgi:hypothetical protein
MNTYDLVGELAFSVTLQATDRKQAERRLRDLLLNVRTPPNLFISDEPEWVDVEDDEEEE